jgi:hypothetical protein
MAHNTMKAGRRYEAPKAHSRRRGAGYMVPSSESTRTVTYGGASEIPPRSQEVKGLGKRGETGNDFAAS